MLQTSKIPLMVTSEKFSTKLEGKEAEDLMDNPRPVLWQCQGLWCWVSLIQIKNMAKYQRDRKAYCRANDLEFNPVFCLQWSGTPSGTAVKEMAQAIEVLINEGEDNV